MNEYLKNLNKIEFVVTDACTGNCKHCSEGNHTGSGKQIDPTVAAEPVRKIAAAYPITTVMAFGGEPLLCPDTVCAIMDAARQMKVSKRQVITNGYFSNHIERIREVATQLSSCGVNDLLLSVDAFHQETIPLDTVKIFAIEAQKCGIPIRLQPAWLISANNDNPYNRKTRALLDSFTHTGICENEGNIVFPEGNALRYLAEYFADHQPENPYVEDPQNVRCASFSPNGDVLDGNVYQCDIMEILRKYNPFLARKNDHRTGDRGSGGNAL